MISVTMLSAYLYCKRKMFLEYILKLSEPPKDAIVKGSIRHQAIDMANKAEEEIVNSISEIDGLEDIKNKYVREYTKILRKVIVKNKGSLRRVQLPLIDAYRHTWKFFENIAEVRAESVFRFKAEHNIFGKELWEKLTPKIRSEVRIESEGLGLKGIVDMLEVFDSYFIPLELKTGKAPKEGVWPGHRIQIAAYMLLLSEKFNLEVKRGYIDYMDIKDKREIVMNPMLREEVIETVKFINNLLKSQEVPDFCDNENKCNSCGLREKCYNEGLILAKTKALK